MTFFRRHLSIAGRFHSNRIEREDTPEYPVLALREAVVNALIHRSYVDAGGAVSIAIFADRLEIWSEGGLPFGQRPEELKRAHTSRPRNPLIANVFFRRCRRRRPPRIRSFPGSPGTRAPPPEGP